VTTVDVLGVALGMAWALVVGSMVSTRARRSGLRRPGAVAGSCPSLLQRRSGPQPSDHLQGSVPTSTTGWMSSRDRARESTTGSMSSRLPGSTTNRVAGRVPGIAPIAGSWRRSPVAELGAAVRRLAGAHAPDGAAGGTPDAPAPGRVGDGCAPVARDLTLDRRTGWAALASGCLLPLAPPLAAVPLTWALASPVLAGRRRRGRREAMLHDQLPDVVDLLALTTAAGLPVSAALVAIDDRPGGPLGAALARASAHLRHGGSTAGALAVLAAVGPPVRPLVDALAQHDRYGTPLLPALTQVSIEARARRRRRSEEAARRLPVTLLFPLILTTFPAFVLLTVVPLLAGSLGSLSLSPT
jgi:tight adherence protein C